MIRSTTSSILSISTRRKRVGRAESAATQSIRHSASIVSTTSRRPHADNVYNSSLVAIFASGTAAAAAFLALYYRSDDHTPIQLESPRNSFELKDKYEVSSDILGEGGYGKVYRAWRRSDSVPVAIKEIDPKLTDEAEFEREIQALTTLSRNGGHPNICRLFDVYRHGDRYYVAMEIIMGGELLEHLILNGAYSEADAAKFVRQLAEAISFMHGSSIAHSDLKCENLMLSSWETEKASLKVVDFGCAASTDENGRGVDASCDYQGTSAYCPPERLKENGPPTLASDMFAVGCIVYVLLTGTHPFDARGTATNEDIEQLITALTPDASGERLLHALVFDERTKDLSKSCIDLMKSLMNPNPAARMTADEFRRHPWVQGLEASWKKMAYSNRKLEAFWQKRFRAAILKKYAAATGRKGSLSDSNLRHMFHSIDLDGNGLLDPHELRVALRQLGITEENASLMIASADLDKSGEIDMEEFFIIMRKEFDDGPGVRITNQKRFQTAVLSMFTHEDNKGSLASLRRVFSLIDLDGNGKLDYEELRIFLGELGIPDDSIAGIIEIVDLDDNGTVDWDEFVTIMRKTFHGESVVKYKGNHKTHTLFSTP